MGKLVYHVAVSVDGFIARQDGSIDGFIMQGEHADEYARELQDYGVSIMGRKTYEFGYQYGMPPGTNPYKHMQTYVISDSLQLPKDKDLSLHQLGRNSLPEIRQILEDAQKDVYLCGGSLLAGYLLSHRLIHRLVLKVNPVVLGQGRPLFENFNSVVNLNLLSAKKYENGVFKNEYQVLTQ